MELKQLVASVREVCPPRLFSRGVELAREATVRIVTEDALHWTLAVRVRGKSIVPTVTLYKDEPTWDCTCGSEEEACEHVAAAALALASERGVTRDEDGAAGRLLYRFGRDKGFLTFTRVLRRLGEETPLGTSLIGLARGLGGGPVAAGPADVAIERALAGFASGVVPRAVVRPLCTALATAPAGVVEVTLDGRPLEVSGQPMQPIVAVVEDAGEGFRVRAERPSDVDEIFGNGALLAGGVLRPAADVALTARERDQLPRGIYVAREGVAELVNDTLPSLARRVTVDVRTARLPRTARVAPRAVVATREDARGLAVLAKIVYGDPPLAVVDGTRLVPLGGDIPMRDATAEAVLADRLHHQLDLVPGVEEIFEGERAVAFAARLGRFSGSVEGDAHARYWIAPPLEPVYLGPATDGEGFPLAFETPSGNGRGLGERADAEAVLRAWQAGGALAPLPGGGWAPIPREWLARHGRLVADLLAARDENGAVARSALADVGRLAGVFDAAPPPALAALRALVDGFTGIPEAPLPDDFTATLRHYQRDGVDWLSFHRGARFGALLADDMGLGKTVQALAALPGGGRTLVVAPASVVFNWENEARRFRPGLRVNVYHGANRRLDDGADLTLTTYSLLRLDQDALAARRWDAVVLDEAQAIKNPDSQVARAAFRLDAAFRLALTGTPVENRLEELWSLFRFLNPGHLGPRADFETRIARAVGAGDDGAAARLRERIGPFVLRRLKRDVAPELPPRTEVTLHCELAPAERAVYDAVRAAARADIAALLGKGGSVLEALETLLRLRQAACHPALVPGQSADTSSKVELLMETLDTILAEDHKALVFSQWTSLLDLVEPHLERAGVRFARLDGATRDRGAVVAAFQDQAGPPVLLVSLKAGGVGLNLTAADHVFLLDPWWNPATEDQAIDRAHRIGQDRPVLVHRLVAEGTVEERILALQEHKRALADAALAGASTGPAALTRDDLLALLGD